MATTREPADSYRTRVSHHITCGNRIPTRRSHGTLCIGVSARFPATLRWRTDLLPCRALRGLDGCGVAEASKERASIRALRLADVLTASRIVAAPIIVWLIVSDERAAAYYLFAAAAITDLLDGYFARRSGKLASYGAAFDGLADFFLIFPTMFALGVKGEATWLFAASLAAITYIVVVLGLISKKQGRVIVPHLNTNLLAAVVYPTIMVHIIQWQYAEIVLLFAFCGVVLPYYGTKYLLYLKRLY